MDVIVVLPTYNEAATLSRVVSGVLDQDAGVLVVDDGSPDGTGDLADELARSHGPVSVLHRPKRQGLGRALAAGLWRARLSGAAVVCQMDADGSHDPADLPRLLAAVDSGADLAVGSRFAPGGGFVDVPWHRRLLSRLGNEYARHALGMSTRDATTGFRAMRSEVLDEVDPAQAVAAGYAFQIEMAWRAEGAGFTVVEVPITFRPRGEGKSKIGPGVVAEALLLVTRWGWQRLRSR